MAKIVYSRMSPVGIVQDYIKQKYPDLVSISSDNNTVTILFKDGFKLFTTTNLELDTFDSLIEFALEKRKEEGDMKK